VEEEKALFSFDRCERGTGTTKRDLTSSTSLESTELSVRFQVLQEESQSSSVPMEKPVYPTIEEAEVGEST